MTNFADFADFLSMKALKMNSAYYKAIFTTPKYESCDWFGKGRSFNDVTPSLQKLSRKAEFARSRSKKVSECVCYGKKHYLHVCEETFADKKRFVCTKRLCFRCLKGGHMIKECRSSKTYAESSCSNTDHHTLLHPDQPLVENPAPVSSATSRDFDVHVDKTSSTCTCLNIYPVSVRHGGKEILTNARLDPVSSITFCEPVLVKTVGLRGKGSMCSQSVLSQNVILCLSSH